MTVLKTLLKFAVIFIVFTVIGQIRFHEQTLEYRYHEYVNSENFQKSFTRLTKPATWTFEKISQAIRRNSGAQAR